MKKFVLVVEDNPVDARLLEDLLHARGYDVDSVERASIALEAAGGNKPDLIIMDIQLPGMDGYETVSILKKHPLTEHIPVIAVTAYPKLMSRDKALKAGCDEYMNKPINTRGLVELVERLIGPVED